MGEGLLRGRWRPAALGFLALALAVVAPGVAPRVAEAHAALVRADPPVNAQLRESPKQMTLYFSEAVERKVSAIKVFDGSQKRVDTGVEFDDQDNALMRVNLNQLDPGYYKVSWETLSRVDGHRIAGSYPITVLKADGSLPAGTNPNAAGVTASVSGTNAKPERVASKAALLIAGSIVAGALVFSWVALGMKGDHADDAKDAAVGRIVGAAAAGVWVLAIAGFIDLLLQANANFGSLTNFPDVISGTRWGQLWIIRNALVPPLAIGLIALYRQKLDSRASKLIVLTLLALAFGYLALTSLVSHAAAGRGSFWSTTSDFVHLVAASVWIGLLLQVGLLIWWARRTLPRDAQPGILATGLQRFSLLAVLSIALLLFTGVLNAAIELTKLNDLLDTGYGQTLLIKLLLLLPLLFAGGLNAYLFRPQVVEEAERAETGRAGGLSSGWEDLESTFYRTVRIEAGLAALVLVVVGVLVQLQPSRSALAAPTPSGKFTQTKQVGPVGVTLNIDPNQPGNNTFEAYLTGDTGSVERVRLLFDEQKKGAFQSELVLDQSPTTPLYFVGSGAFINESGKWKVTVDLRRGAGSSSDLSTAFDVKVSGGTPVSSDRSGSALQAPAGFSTATIAFLVAVGVLCVALVVASLDQPDRPAGTMGDLADRLAGFEMRPGISLAALVVVGIGLGILVGTHTHTRLSGSQATQGNPVKSSPQSIARGQELFQQNCTQCHGESGRGDGPLAPSLRLPPANLYDHIPYHPDQFFFDIITNGAQGVMPSFADTINSDDRWNILNYLRSRFAQPPAAQ